MHSRRGNHRIPALSAFSERLYSAGLTSGLSVTMPRFPVIEEQLDVEVFSVELNSLLASDEGEIGTHFQQEHLQFTKDSVSESP